MAVPNQCAAACRIRVSSAFPRLGPHSDVTPPDILPSHSAPTIPSKACPSQLTSIRPRGYGYWRIKYVRSHLLSCVWSAHPFLAHLKSQLNESRNGTSRSISPSRRMQLAMNGNVMASGSSHSGRTPEESPVAGGIVLPHASLDVLGHLSPTSSGSRPGSVGSPEIRHIHSHARSVPDPLMDILFSGWDPDLPDPDTLDH